MAVSLTESAARQITKQLEKRGKGLGLRLGVKPSGCSGLAYVIDYADEVSDSDLLYEQYGVKLIVNRDHLAALNGVVVDYTREGINEAFRFNNPNVKASCGCGESFAV